MSIGKLAQITAPHFVAGLIFIDRKVVEAAPIIRYMEGWTADLVKQYVDKKKWSITSVPPKP